MTLEITCIMFNHVYIHTLFNFIFFPFSCVVAHVDNPPTTNSESDSKVGLPTAAGGTVNAGPTASTLSSVPADAVLTRATECARFGIYDAVQICSFTELDDVKAFRKLFAECILSSVTVTVTSLVAFPPGTSARILRFGLVGRGTALVDTVGSAQVSKADRITYAKHFVAGSTVNSSVTHTWGAGGEPFPPGLQLDFNYAEVRFAVPQLFLACVNPRTKDDKVAAFDIAYWHVEYTVIGRGVAGLQSFRESI